MEPLDLRQLSRFLISEMQRLVGLSVEAIDLSSAEKMLTPGVRRHDWEMFRSGMKTGQLEVGGGGLVTEPSVLMCVLGA